LEDFNTVVARIKQLANLKTNYQVAHLLGIKPWQLSSRKKHGTLLPTIVEWAIREYLSLDWLLHGYGFPSIHARTHAPGAFPAATGDGNATPGPGLGRIQDSLAGSEADLPIAEEIARNLAELEAIAPAALHHASAYIKGLLDGVKQSTGQAHAYEDPGPL
jgi:hypothetical protein